MFRYIMQIGLLLILWVLSAAAPVEQQDPVTVEPPVPDTQPALIPQQVRVARIRTEWGRTMLGEIVGEDEHRIQFLRIDSTGTISYRKEDLAEIELHVMDAASYYAMRGDRLSEAAMSREDARPLFAEAARAYRTSLNLEPSEEVQAKYDRLIEERDRLLALALRRERLEQLRFENLRARDAIESQKAAVNAAIERVERQLRLLEDEVLDEDMLLPSRIRQLRRRFRRVEEMLDELRSEQRKLSRTIDEASKTEVDD